MASFCPLLTTSTRYSFDDAAINLYSQELQNQQNYFKITTSSSNLHHSCNDRRPIASPYFPTSFPTSGGCEDLLPPSVLGISGENASKDAMEAEKKRKKMDHNASERDRRKKINTLFGSLRDVLPLTDQPKLSNPATLTLALKYIPELQNNIQIFTQRKRNLLSMATTNFSDQTPLASNTTSSSSSSSSGSSSYSVQTTELGNGEISIKISTLKPLHKISMIPISRFLRELEEEEEGLVVMNALTTESSSGIVFYHIHLMVEASCGIKCALLRDKLLHICATNIHLRN